MTPIERQLSEIVPLFVAVCLLIHAAVALSWQSLGLGLTITCLTRRIQTLNDKLP